MASLDAYCLLAEEREPSTFQEALRSSNKWKPYVEIRHGNLLNFQKAKKSLVANGFTKSNEMTMIKWNDIVQDWWLKDMLRKKNLKRRYIYSNKKAYRIRKIYDLKQISMHLDYNRLSLDHCTYYNRFDDNDFVILVLYVNDMVLQLASEFGMKDLGPTNKILGMQIHRDKKDREIWLSQMNYLQKVLQCFNMQDHQFLPHFFMSPNNEAKRMEMSRVLYASTIENLIYVMIFTRADIAQVVE
ncbi:hypothetical protein CR513_23597, partial [Mucuna pruriens]